MFSKYNESKD